MGRRGLAALAVAVAAFFAAVEDMPLMPGLVEAPGASTIFDKPEGRIVQLVAAGRADRSEVLGFYADTLPQLGWRKAADGTWRRENEILRLEVKPKGRESELRISIAPARTTR
jgi:hypothetical protein